MSSHLLMAISFGVCKCVVKKWLRVDHFGLSDTDFCQLAANRPISKTVSPSVADQLGLNIGSTAAF